MTDSIPGGKVEQGLRRRPLLGRRQGERLLADVERSPRARALYTVAMKAKLGARECAALDVRDVTNDGLTTRELALVRRTDRRWRHAPDVREVALPPDARAALDAYLAWRRGRCAHFKHRLKSYRDLRGIERCHACHDVMDFPSAPLFLSRRNGRLSARGLWKELRGIRARLGLDEGLSFESLRAMPRRELVSTGRPAAHRRAVSPAAKP